MIHQKRRFCSLSAKLLYNEHSTEISQWFHGEYIKCTNLHIAKFLAGSKGPSTLTVNKLQFVFTLQQSSLGRLQWM